MGSNLHWLVQFKFKLIASKDCYFLLAPKDITITLLNDIDSVDKIECEKVFFEIIQ